MYTGKVMASCLRLLRSWECDVLVCPIGRQNDESN